MFGFACPSFQVGMERYITALSDISLIWGWLIWGPREENFVEGLYYTEFVPNILPSTPVSKMDCKVTLSHTLFVET